MKNSKSLYILKRKYIFFVAVLMAVVLCLNNKKICYAGGINSNEARILSVARGTFEYDGEMYVAKQEYVNMLIAKLSEDGINFTAEQADVAISNVYANIQTGVESGYIVKVDSPEDNLDREQKDEITEIAPEEKEQQDEEQNMVPDKIEVNENDNGTLTVEDGKGNVVLEFEGVLKNTGFSMEKTIIILTVIGVILTCVVIYSVKDIIAIHKK